MGGVVFVFFGVGYVVFGYVGVVLGCFLLGGMGVEIWWGVGCGWVVGVGVCSGGFGELVNSCCGVGVVVFFVLV